jgi:hypothetical protein
MTKKTIFSLLKGKSYYNGMNALAIQGLRIEAINDGMSILVGNDKFLWNIFYAKGLRGRPAWSVGNPIER